MPIPTQQQYDAVISYRHKSSAFYMARILYMKLTAEGYSVFMDKNMGSGEFESEICAAIHNCRNFIQVFFPEDIPYLRDEQSWLNKEAKWAFETPDITIIPVMCGGFNWDAAKGNLTDTMIKVSKNNGVCMHQDYSLEADLELLRSEFLKNVHPAKLSTSAVEFCLNHLSEKDGERVMHVDMAFHGGSEWFANRTLNALLVDLLEDGVAFRVLINTVEAADKFAAYIEQDHAVHSSLQLALAQWQTLKKRYPQYLEVRVCKVPLLHTYHQITLCHPRTKWKKAMFVRYYTYKNSQAESSYQHELPDSSPYQALYRQEFEYLWGRSSTL